MKTVYTTSLYSVEVDRDKMEKVISACRHGNGLDREEFKQMLGYLLLSDSLPDMMDREFDSIEEASRETNHGITADYSAWTVPFFRLSGRVIDRFKYNSEDDDAPECIDAVEIDIANDETIDYILEQF